MLRLCLYASIVAVAAAVANLIMRGWHRGMTERVFAASAAGLVLTVGLLAVWGRILEWADEPSATTTRSAFAALMCALAGVLVGVWFPGRARLREKAAERARYGEISLWKELALWCLSWHRRSKLAPYADKIDLLTRAFALSLGRHGHWVTGVIDSHKIRGFRKYVEDYALRTHSLPVGCHTIFIPGSRNGIQAHTRQIDFDALTTTVKGACARFALPETYRLPRHRRVRHFRKQTDALVAAFAPTPVRRPTGPRGRELSRLELGWFLKDFVLDYERLPRGRMRITPDQHIPLSRDFIDAGEVDFDQLRGAAGLA